MRPALSAVLPKLMKPHAFWNSIEWRLTDIGIETPCGVEVWDGHSRTVLRIWEEFSDPIITWASAFGVPVELIVACILTEHNGCPGCIHEKPGYVSDDVTPERVRVGLMPNLISTARETLQDRTIGRAWLLDPGNSIRAGTACIALQEILTHFDPPKVAAVYNAGGLYWDPSPRNRWKMKQYPVRTAEHVDRFIKWLNEAFAMFQAVGDAPEMSFFRVLRSVPPGAEQGAFAGFHAYGLTGLKKRDRDGGRNPQKTAPKSDAIV